MNFFALKLLIKLLLRSLVSIFFVGGVLYKCIPLIGKAKKNMIWRIIEIPFLISAIIVGIVFTKLFNRDIGMFVGFSLTICGSIYGYSIIVENKVTKLLGKISYSVYLPHMVVIQILIKFGIIQFITSVISNKFASYIVTATTILTFTFIISYFSTEYIWEYFAHMGAKYIK